MKLAKAVHDAARRLSLIAGTDRGVLNIVRDVARAWIREAYLAGYRDGVTDARTALDDTTGYNAERMIAEAARKREAIEVAALDAERAAFDSQTAERDTRRREAFENAFAHTHHITTSCADTGCQHVGTDREIKVP